MTKCQNETKKYKERFSKKTNDIPISALFRQSETTTTGHLAKRINTKVNTSNVLKIEITRSGKRN